MTKQRQFRTKILNSSSQSVGLFNVCPNCGTKPASVERYCFTCKYDLGAPNVRFAQMDATHLECRYKGALSAARRRGSIEAAKNFANAVHQSSCVVVAMPAAYARVFVQDPHCIFENYETLVGAGVRKPARFDEDRQRYGVGGILFGASAPKIKYGCLSLSGAGLSTYGEVFFRLRNVAIQNRTSFLEQNSYEFVRRNHLTPGAPIPDGHRATWDNRQKLAIAKLAARLPSKQGKSVWQPLLVVTDGKNRENDDFIEAHIYDSFDVNAVQDVRLAGDLPPKVRRDARIAVELFEKRNR